MNEATLWSNRNGICDSSINVGYRLRYFTLTNRSNLKLGSINIGNDTEHVRS